MNLKENILQMFKEIWNMDNPFYEKELLQSISVIEDDLSDILLKEIKKIQLTLEKDRFFYREIRYASIELDKYKHHFRKGYQTFEDLFVDKSGCFIIDHDVLENSNRNILEFFYQYLPEVFVRHCAETFNPVLLWPLLDRIENSDFNQSFFNVLHLLPPSLKGFCSANLYYVMYEEKKQFLSLFHLYLSDEELWMVMGTVLEMLLRKSYPSTYMPVRGIEEDKRLFLESVKWLAEQHGAQQEWAKDAVEKYFLPSLAGRVNQESFLAVFFLRNELRTINSSPAKQNSEMLANLMLDRYPKFWEKKDKQRGLYFSGQQSVDLLENLADLFFEKYKDGALNQLLVFKGIPNPFQLWTLRNQHDYSAYLHDRQLLQAHVVLMIKVARKISGDSTNPLWKRVSSSVVELCKQFIDGYFNETDKLFFRELFDDCSEFLEEDVLVSIIKHFSTPLLIVYLSRGISSSSTIHLELKRKVEKYLPSMKHVQQLELVHSLYEVKNWELCKMVFDSIRFWEMDRKHIGEHHYRMYVASIISGYDEGLTGIDSSDLHQALRLLEQYERKYRYQVQEHYYVLRGYLINILFGLGDISDQRLKREIALLEMKESKEFYKTLSYVKALLYLDLIDTQSNIDLETASKLEQNLGIAITLDEVKQTVMLMYVWLYEKTNDRKKNTFYMEHLLKVPRKGWQEITKYPKQLWPIIESLKEDHDD